MRAIVSPYDSSAHGTVAVAIRSRRNWTARVLAPLALVGGGGGDRARRQRLARRRRRRATSESSTDRTQPTPSGVLRPDGRTRRSRTATTSSPRRTRPASAAVADETCIPLEQLERAEPEPRPADAPGRGTASTSSRRLQGARPADAAHRAARRRGAGGVARRSPCCRCPPTPTRRAARARRGRWIVIDAGDGEMLAAHTARRLALDRVDDEADDRVRRAPRRCRSTRRSSPPTTAPSSSAESLLGLEAGERIRSATCSTACSSPSGNDAAVALADAVGGSVETFVEQMNRAAAKLGLDDTRYANPIGLDDPGNYSSAARPRRARHRLRARPRLPARSSTRRARRSRAAPRPRTVDNRNNLVLTIPWVNGVKTGYTLEAGNVLVGSGEPRRAVELISAVLGAPSESGRDAELARAARVRLLASITASAGARAASAGRRRPVATRTDARAGRGATAVAVDAPRATSESRPRSTRPVEVEGPIERGERARRGDRPRRRRRARPDAAARRDRGRRGERRRPRSTLPCRGPRAASTGPDRRCSPLAILGRRGGRCVGDRRPRTRATRVACPTWRRAM